MTSETQDATRCAVVTGASSGIGRAIARRLAEAGFSVGVHANQNVDAASSLAEELRQLDVNATVLVADLADPIQVAGLVQAAWQQLGNVDVWVNNAGQDVLTGDWAERSFEQKLERLWHVDVLGTVRCSRLAGQRMTSRGHGCIINIGWDQAWLGMEGDSGEMFATIKGAVMAYTKSLAKSLAPHVRVNCVAPGWIQTAWGENAPDYWAQRAVGESLRGRWGQPEDIAHAVNFLASDEADFVNGQILPVNGGLRHTAARADDEATS